MAQRPQLPLQSALTDSNGKITAPWSFYLTTVQNQLPAPGQQPFNGIGGNTTLTANVLAVNNLTFSNLTVNDITANIGVITNLTTSTIHTTGGAINNTAIGATTPSTGAFTTLTASTFAGNVAGFASNVITNANLMGDVTSIGNATTLATVNSNTGVFGDSSHIPHLTVNSKGLITAVSNIAVPTTVQISGDATSTGGTTSSNAILTLNSVNSNIGSFGNATYVPQYTVNAKGLITSASNVAISFPNGMVYPSSGIATSTGTAWSSSYQTNGTGNVVLDTNSNISVTSLTVTNTITGNISGSALTATAVTNPTQTVITSVGTLGNLTVSGNVTAGNFIGNLATSKLVGTIANSQLANSSIVIGNTTSSLGSTISSIGNLTLQNATISSGNVSAVILTANQPNITSIGTLGNLSVSNTMAAANVTVSSNMVLPALSSNPSSTATGGLYYNTTTNSWQGYTGSTWTAVAGAGSTGGGALGGGTNQAFNENDKVVIQNYTIGSGAYQSGTTVTGNIFTLNTHNFVTDSQIHFTGNIPSGIVTDTVYYVISGNLTTNTFTISNIGGGSQLTGITNSNVSFSTGKIRNAEVAGPFFIATGVNVSIPTGSTISVI